MLVGIDVVDVDRFKKLIDNESFLNKYFTEYEKQYIAIKPKPVETLAGLYASKESFLKALGIGIGGGVDIKDIHIKHTELGKPYFDTSILTTNERLKEINLSGSDLSISHTGKICTAICILF